MSVDGCDGRVAGTRALVGYRLLLFNLFGSPSVIFALYEEPLYFAPGLAPKNSHSHLQIVQFFVCPASNTILSVLG